MKNKKTCESCGLDERAIKKKYPHLGQPYCCACVILRLNQYIDCLLFENQTLKTEIYRKSLVN
jgi:hypothetical protein